MNKNLEETRNDKKTKTITMFLRFLSLLLSIVNIFMFFYNRFVPTWQQTFVQLIIVVCCLLCLRIDYRNYRRAQQCASQEQEKEK